MIFLAMKNDLKRLIRNPFSVCLPLIFFIMVLSIQIFTIQNDLKPAQSFGYSLLFVALLLSLFLQHGTLFEFEASSGILEELFLQKVPLESVFIAKTLGLWAFQAIPLLLCTPVAALLLDINITLQLLCSLSLTSLGLAVLLSLGAAISLKSTRSQLLVPVLLLPFATPVLIFGLGAVLLPNAAALLYLAGLVLGLCAITPWLGALALKNSL